MSPSVGGSLSETSTAELGTLLGGPLGHHFGAPCRVAKVERRRSAYCTSFSIEELVLHLDHGRTLELVIKDLGWGGLGEAARGVKPRLLYDPLREIETYRAILAPSRLGTPVYYGSIVDRRLGRYWLLLEHVAGVPLWQAGELSVWRQAARWVAALHARFIADTERLTRAAPLLIYDADFYRRWPRRAQRFVSVANPCRAQSMRWLAERYDGLIERLMTLPVTLIHGEFVASNVLVSEGGGLRVCPIDWEMAAVGPGLIDLAALTAGRWDERDRTAMALAYRDELARHGRPIDTEALLVALRWCRVHLAVQWLGWSAEWSPPPEHVQDWLGEAVRLAERLGL
jgi:aminoglycoside phosphotransferase (APT) family kinase protein